MFQTSAKAAHHFNFRKNNIDTSPENPGGPTSSNFNYDFFEYASRTYVLLVVHYGYDEVFKEAFIVADLDQTFNIDQQYCHFQVSVKNTSGTLNRSVPLALGNS